MSSAWFNGENLLFSRGTIHGPIHGPRSLVVPRPRASRRGRPESGPGLAPGFPAGHRLGGVDSQGTAEAAGFFSRLELGF